jgi:hypothetical protein
MMKHAWDICELILRGLGVAALVVISWLYCFR